MGISIPPRPRTDGDVVLSALVKSMPLGVLVVGSDGAVTIANEHADAIFRARALQLVGLAVEDLLPEFGSGLMCAEHEGTGRRLDGSDVPLRFRLQWVPVRDRHERVVYFCEASESALAEPRRHWHGELLNGTDLITQVDLDGRFLHVNQAAEHVFGVAADECVGMSGFDFIHPEDRDETVGRFEAWLSEGSTSTTLENRQIARSGSVRRMLWTANATYDADGGVETVLSVAHDITYREQLHALERRFLQEQLGLATERARAELRHEVRQRSLRAREEEKRRIARELDQEAERLVAGVRLQLRQIDQAEDLADVRAVVQEATKRLSMAGQELKSLARQLRPPVLDELGIVRALEQLGTEVGIALTVELACDAPRHDVGTVVYRAARAVLLDVADDARVTGMTIRIAEAGQALVMSLTGAHGDLRLDTDPTAREALMRALQNLAAPVAGRASLDAGSGAGTTIRFEIPLQALASEVARDRVTVVLCIEQMLVREAARQALRQHDDIVVVAEASTLPGALRALEVHRPSVLVFDFAYDGTWLESVAAVSERCRSTRVLAFCPADEPGAAGHAERAGASGCVDRRISTSDLVTAIRDLSAGHRYVDPALEPTVESAGGEASEVTRSLTQRELEVFELLALGHTNQEIAEQLVVSARTVEAHRTRLQQKLGVRSRAELVRCALYSGLLRMTA